MSLIDDARLTKPEKVALFTTCFDDEHAESVDYAGGSTGHTGECFAEAATAKALWAVAYWLETNEDDEVSNAGSFLGAHLLELGIKVPTS